MAEQATKQDKAPANPAAPKTSEQQESRGSQVKKGLAGMDFAAQEKALAPPTDGPGAGGGPPMTYGGGS
ncbi:MAG: hypothetical protein EP329_03680 [Deltaproteobacteria bacterium]|nr:MAG: hypothetical protein EP329_03680 [Deltaproteobacteria bacterium]